MVVGKCYRRACIHIAITLLPHTLFIGTIIITFTFEGLRILENGINRAEIFTNQVVGLTEVTLALAMIGVLILRPGGLFSTREIGTSMVRLFQLRNK